MIQVLLALFTGPVFASAPHIYDISMKLKANGKEIASPRIVVTEGETAKITQGDEDGTTYWEILATESDSQILLNMTVGKIDKTGRPFVLSSPRFLTHENQAAEMVIGEGESELTLSVTAKRKAL